ncbi:Rrf2 family transcriptional regulator [Hydrogenophaga borbori]|uniref:Rrf2 family transcriptional regulator n=1 Tax=Hydrogenophaga borbori TaxID=2294117 RepID=A0A372EKE6_9BURK|nr:Rrf2 family transcriptional regulator [Hydrogenophaga borbori]RFP79365.1 Rrf2 family transcriptional regulator [Hydrogenophaga borbori]
MKDSKLSSVLHVLLHMAQAGAPMTSEQLARMLGTNPVVVRKILAGLRDAGFVVAGKGHGGGWTIGVDLRRVTLRDVYEAVGAPTVFAMGHRNEQPACLVEQAVNAALDDTLAAARALIDQRLAAITLADLSADFDRRLRAHPHREHSHEH